MKKNRALLIFQGIYYFFIGLWGVVSIKSFTNFIGYHTDIFLQHTIAALFLGLGLLYLFSVRNLESLRTTTIVAFIVAVLISAIEFFNLGAIGGTKLKYDMVVEIIFALLAAGVVLVQPRSRTP